MMRYRTGVCAYLTGALVEMPFMDGRFPFLTEDEVWLYIQRLVACTGYFRHTESLWANERGYLYYISGPRIFTLWCTTHRACKMSRFITPEYIINFNNLEYHEHQ
ncbi:hypothetical protein QCA50_005790 [Cerrena zonata]|uniref:Uncharacterized protein n=1 Tax=Cerrena zonata TaxID=2478898 RepID=A0AAW0GM73_9APHY